MKAMTEEFQITLLTIAVYASLTVFMVSGYIKRAQPNASSSWA